MDSAKLSTYILSIHFIIASINVILFFTFGVVVFYNYFTRADGDSNCLPRWLSIVQTTVIKLDDALLYNF